MTFGDPVTETIRQLRANELLINYVPQSHIHEGYPYETPDVPGVYIAMNRFDMHQIASSDFQVNRYMTGACRFQVTALSNDGTSEARKIGLIACEAAMPSVPLGGLYGMNYNVRGQLYDRGYTCWRIDIFLEASYAERISGEAAAMGTPESMNIYDKDLDGIVDLTEGIRDLEGFPSTANIGELILINGKIYIRTDE